MSTKIDYSKIPLLNFDDYEIISDDNIYFTIRNILNMEIKILKENNFFSFSSVKKYILDKISDDKQSETSQKKSTNRKIIPSHFFNYIGLTSTKISKYPKNMTLEKYELLGYAIDKYGEIRIKSSFKGLDNCDTSLSDWIHPYLFFPLLAYLSTRIFIEKIHQYYNTKLIKCIDNFNFNEEILIPLCNTDGADFSNYFNLKTLPVKNNYINASNALIKYCEKYNMVINIIFLYIFCVNSMIFNCISELHNGFILNKLTIFIKFFLFSCFESNIFNISKNSSKINFI